MQIKITHFIYLLSFLISCNLNAQSSNNYKDYSFKRIGIEQGLSQSTIHSIAQDKRGYMWFGTATGLNRYDGYEFIVYKNNAEDSLSISSNEITSIYIDDDGIIWIGTGGGVLNKFDPKTEEFIHFDIASSSDWYSSDEDKFYDYPLTFSRHQISSITSIAQDKWGNFWLGTWGKGIVKFNPKTESKKYFYHFKNKPNTLTSNSITKLLIDENQYLWIGTFGGGLNRIKLNSNDGIKISNYSKNGSYQLGDRITSIFEDSKGKIWIGSYEGGISVLSSDQKYKHTDSLDYLSLHDQIISNTGLMKQSVMSILEDNDENIWIGTFGNGLYNYNIKNNEIHNFLNDVEDETSLSENEIQIMFIDDSGILWIGTQLGSGINKLEVGSKKFKNAPLFKGENKSLNDNIVWAVHEDKENNIWIGTQRGGLNKWDRKSNSFKYYKKENNLADNHIRAITEDKFGNIWIGSYSGGLSYFNKKTDKITNYSLESSNSNIIKSNQVQTLLLDSNSILWAGTFGGGLNKIDLNTFYRAGKLRFTQYSYHPTNNNSISDNRVYKLYNDSKGILWIATHGGGLNKFDKAKEEFIQYKADKSTISSDRILSILETKNGNMLIGTFGGGLNLYKRSEDNFERIDEKLAMNCSDIYGILADKNGYWISTNNGIYKISEDLNSFRHFDLSDGLQSLEFSGGAYCIGKDGTYYFGGINGLNYFNPEKIKINDFIPPVVISKVSVFDKPIKGENESLTFGKDENYFSFEFASLDYANSNKNKYKFRLEGLDKKWSFTDADNRKVYYTNLAPGDYSFKVQGTNNDGIWSNEEAQIDITILAPFWMRWWFISLLILFIGALITFFINQRFKYLLALDKLKTNISADLHDNVGAGLTEISILSELATNQIYKPESATRNLAQISELSRQLVESMSDIVWVVNPSRDSLYDLIVRLKDMYGELLADLGIVLKTSNLDELVSVKLPMDYRQNLYLILKESINNSIKHGKCKNIDLKINAAKSNLILQLSDDGIGFDKNSKTLGNGLINIKERGQKIGGKVNITSNVSNGTTIKFEGKIK